MDLPEVENLAQLLRRMAALEIGSRDLRQVQHDWSEMRRTLEREFAKPDYPDGELQRQEAIIYATRGFKNFNRVRRAAFLASPQGKAKRSIADAKWYAKRNTPEYRESKRAYDQERYERRKAAKGGL